MCNNVLIDYELVKILTIVVKECSFVIILVLIWSAYWVDPSVDLKSLLECFLEFLFC
jgi:hypothetical protein